MTRSTSGFLMRIRWFMGMCMAALFSMIYILAPVYVLSVGLVLYHFYPWSKITLIYAAPLFLSIIFPSTPSSTIVGWLRPMLDYFDYERITERGNLDPRDEILSDRKNYILAAQPHGVISFVGICSAIEAPAKFRNIKTAVASSLLQTPILKHVMGIFNLTDASSSNLSKILKKKGVDGCIVLYVGGIAELFKTSRDEERLYLSERKGFIKLALRSGVDIIPVYLFGNTSVLSIVKSKVLASISRRMQVSLTLFWGKFQLPIPRDEKLLYVSAPPMGMPQIDNPTQEDINFWHAKYCEEVKRLFNNYKERVPAYKHKKLYID